MAALAFVGYGRPVQAACVNNGGSTYLCSGAETTTQIINADEAAVSTAADFSIDTTGTGGNAITITGDGALSFTDANGVPISGAVNGIDMTATGDSPAANASVTIETAQGGTVSGGQFGIKGRSNGAGDVNITANGIVNGVVGPNGIGILAHKPNTDLLGNVLVTTGAQSTVSGYEFGINASTNGYGAVGVTVHGDVFSENVGVQARVNSFLGLGNVSVDVTEGALIDSRGESINTRNFGDGGIDITVDGTVRTRSFAINGITAYNAVAGDLDIDIGETGVVEATSVGVSARSNTAGMHDINITHDGRITNNGGLGSLGLAATQAYDGVNGLGDINITTGANSSITDMRVGLSAVQYGYGDINITHGGLLESTTYGGIVALTRTYPAAPIAKDGDINITTLAGSTVRALGGGADGSVRDAIIVRNDGQGTANITVGGDVEAQQGHGIYVGGLVNGGKAVNITTLAGSSVSGYERGIFVYQEGVGAVTVNVDGEVNALRESVRISRITSFSTEDITFAAGQNAVLNEGVYIADRGTGDIHVQVESGARITALAADLEGIQTVKINGGTTTIDIAEQAIVESSRSGIDAIAQSGGVYDRILVNVDGNIVGGAYGSVVSGVNLTGLVPFQGDLEFTSGANSSVIGADSGVRATHQGVGDITLHLGGQVTGTNLAGVFVDPTAQGFGEVSITTEAGSAVRGGTHGILSTHDGDGDHTLDIGGLVGGPAGIDVTNRARNSTAALRVTTQAGSHVEGGILATQNSLGAFEITINGDIVAVGNRSAVFANLGNNASARDILLTQGPESVVEAEAVALRVVNPGTGDSQIDLGGTVLGQGNGLFAQHFAGTPGDIHIQTRATGQIEVDRAGISVLHSGLGAVDITHEGSIISNDFRGIAVLMQDAASVSPLSVTTAAGSSITAPTDGIRLDQMGAGGIALRVDGAVSATGQRGDGLDLIAADVAVGDAITVDLAGQVSGGWTLGTGLRTGVSETQSVALNIAPGGHLGALSDLALVDGDNAIAILNEGGITGHFQLGGGDDTLTNLSANSLNLRDFEDRNGDGTRDRENVAVADFGAGDDLFVNGEAGVVRLLSVPNQDPADGIADDPAPTPDYFFGLSVPEYFAPGSAQLSANGANGIEQGHILGLERFEHAGVITLADAETGFGGPAAGDVLVISSNDDAAVAGDGVFVSNGGALHLDVLLDDGMADSTDVLVLDNAVTGSGATLIRVTPAGGFGNFTGRGPAHGITIVQVRGDASDTDAFVLDGGAFDRGLYVYDLAQADGQNWVLQSTLTERAVAYPGLAYSLRTLGGDLLGSYSERVGGATVVNTPGGSASHAVPQDAASGATGHSPWSVWARLIGSWSDQEANLIAPDGAFRGDYEDDIWAFQGGVAADMAIGNGGSLRWSGFLHYGEVTGESYDTATSSLIGRTDVDSFGGGLSLTYQRGGLYADLLATYSNADIDMTYARGATADTDADLFGLAFELGYAFALGNAFHLIPQARLAYQSIDIEDFTDSDGLPVRWAEEDSVEGRFGLVAEYHSRVGNGGTLKFSGGAHLTHEFNDRPFVDVAATVLGLDTEDTGVELELGMKWDSVSGSGLWVQGRYHEGFGDGGAQRFTVMAGGALRF